MSGCIVESKNPGWGLGGGKREKEWNRTGWEFKSIHTCQPPCQGFCRRLSAVCHWNTACWWETSWWVYSTALLSPGDWLAAPSGYGDISAWTYIHTGLNNSWLCTASGQLSNPSRKLQSQQSGGNGNSGTPLSAHHSLSLDSFGTVCCSPAHAVPWTGAANDIQKREITERGI